QIQVADRGGAAGHRVGDGVPGLLAVPDIVAAAADADVIGGLGAEGPHGAIVVQPDHQLGAVGLAAGDGRLVEPDVIGHVIVAAAAGLGGAPARGDLAGADAGDLDGKAAAGRARAPVAALVDGRIATGRAVCRVRNRGARHPEGSAAIG